MDSLGNDSVCRSDVHRLDQLPAVYGYKLADSQIYLSQLLNPFLIVDFWIDSMPTISKGDKVLITGANGYIAMWTTRLFLEQGYSVRGTLRSEKKANFLKDYFRSLGIDSLFETVIVEDIVKVWRYTKIIFATTGLTEESRKEHSMRPSKMLMPLPTWLRHFPTHMSRIQKVHSILSSTCLTLIKSSL